MIKIRRITKICIIFLILSAVGCYEIFEPSLTNKNVVLLAPVNNVISDSSIQTLFWQSLTGANEYELEVVSPGFDSIVELITDTSIQINNWVINLSPGRYQWEVRAFNSSSTTPFSAPRNLTIQ